MSKRMGLYARVSIPHGQTVETQLRELRKVAERAGWEVVAEYTDEASPVPRAGTIGRRAAQGCRSA